MRKNKEDDDKFLDAVYALAEKVSVPCTDLDHYLVMCGLIEVLTDVLLDMEDFEEYQAQGNYPGQLFARIFNAILATKRELRELDEAEEERDGATIH